MRGKAINMNILGKYSNETEFSERRKNFVGSSEMPILLGLAKKYENSGGICTPLELWRLKTEKRIPVEKTPQMEWGNRLERVIIDYYLEKNKNPKSLRDTYATKAPLNASADLVLPEKKKIVEIKTTNYFGSKNWDMENSTEEGIPLAVYAQVQMQMMAYAVKNADVVLLANTSEYREFLNIKENKSFQKKCFQLAKIFWRHVEERTPPSPITIKEAVRFFNKPTKTVKVLNPDNDNERIGSLQIKKAIEKWFDLKKKKKEIENEIDNLKLNFLLKLGNDQLIEDPEGKILIENKTTEISKCIKDFSNQIKKLNKDELEFLFDFIKTGKVKITVPSDLKIKMKLFKFGLLENIKRIEVKINEYEKN